MSVLLRESCDKVHCDLLERESAFFGGDAVERCFLFVGQDFVLLTDCTPFYIVCDPLSHSCPWQDFISPSGCLVASRVSCSGVVVDEGHEVSFRGIWDLGRDSVDKEFWSEEGLVFVVIVSLVQVGWT